MISNEEAFFMKKNLARTVFSGVTALLMTAVMLNVPVSTVNAINNPLRGIYVMPPSANGHRYTTDNCLVCDADSLSVVISNGESYLAVTSDLMMKLVEIEKEPVTTEEISEFRRNDMSSFYYAKDTMNVIAFRPVIDKEYEKVVAFQKPEIKYIMDGDNRKIIDYKTDEVLHTFEDELSSCYYLSEIYNYSNHIVYDSEIHSIAPSCAEDPIYLRYMGDIDNNGCVDITDLTELSLYLIGDKEFADEVSSVSDMTNDGTVNLSDLANMKRYIMKAV
jgi:hypothetical protein